MDNFTRRMKTMLFSFMMMISFHSSFADTEVSREVFDDLQQQFVVVNGRILGDINEPLPGTAVTIRALNIGSSTDWDGLFVLDRVPVGKHVIEISYLGYDTFSQEIDVTGDSSSINLGDIVLQPSTSVLGEVVITANVEGQQKAYNLQRTSDNIKTIVSADLVNQFPDINVGEALQRVPGVNIERNNGEGANIRIRGTPRNFTTVSIDGAQLPVTDGGGARTESLDLIPAELLSSMEVTKTPTADMDGDAIGGSVNLKTPTARSRKGAIKGTFAGGYADIFEEGAVRAKLKMDKRFSDGKFGVLFGGSFYNTVIGEERYETVYDSVNVGASGDPDRYRDYLLNELELRPRENVRTRIGFNTTFDYKFTPSSEIFVKLAFNKLEDESERYRIRYRGRGEFLDSSDPTIVGGPDSDARFRKDVADQVTDRENITFTFGGNHNIGTFAKFDYGYSFSRSERFQTVDRTVFRRRGISYRIDQSDRDFPQFVPLDFDPTDISQLEFSAFQRDRPQLTKGNIQTISTNVAFPFSINTKINGELKVGGKIRLQSNSRRRTNNQWGNFDGQYFLDQVVGDDQGSIFEGTYELGAFPSPSRALQHFNDNLSLYTFDDEESIENTLRDTFDVEEDVYATYIQSKFNINDLTVLLGVRYENTEAFYNALFVENRAGTVTSAPISGTPSYDFLLPNVQLKYALNDLTNIRAAFTQSFARPDLFDLVPRENRNVADEEVRKGNPDLQPAFANNFDLSVEHYFATDGIASVGVFHKQIDDFIFQQVSVIDGGPFDGWQQFSPINGEEAELTGVEVALAKKLNFLPGFLSGFGVFLNYTYVTSESSFASLNEETGTTTLREDIPFVGQAEHTYNAALYYDKKGFSARLSLNYNDSSIQSFTQQPQFDRFLDERYQLDGNASYKINDHFTVFLELQNLLDDPVVVFEEVRDRVLNYERYGWTGRFGINFKF